MRAGGKKETDDRPLSSPCARIEMLVLDVDGVMTDGRIVYTDQGEETKAFHVRDGFGVKLWTSLGKKAGIITGRRSGIVERRAKEIGVIAVIQAAGDKKAALMQMIEPLGVTPEQVCCIGDDIIDLPMLRVRPGGCRRRRLRGSQGRRPLRDRSLRRPWGHP